MVGKKIEVIKDKMEKLPRITDDERVISLINNISVETWNEWLALNGKSVDDIFNPVFNFLAVNFRVVNYLWYMLQKYEYDLINEYTIISLDISPIKKDYLSSLVESNIAVIRVNNNIVYDFLNDYMKEWLREVDTFIKRYIKENEEEFTKLPVITSAVMDEGKNVLISIRNDDYDKALAFKARGIPDVKQAVKIMKIFLNSMKKF